MDLRELDHAVDLEEVIRAAFDGLMRGHHTAMPVVVSTDGDGHTAGAQAAIKGTITAPDGTQEQVTLPPLNDLPVHFPGGGGIVSTHPVKAGEGGLAIFASRNIDAWHQAGGVQNPVSDRMHHLADGFFLPGFRADPDKLENVSPNSHQTRSVDGKVTTDHHPTNGITKKVVDASDSTANPFSAAVKFVQTMHSTAGSISHSATDGGTTHQSSVDHVAGVLHQAANGLHTSGSHPSLGSFLKGNSGAHSVTAGPSGVAIASTSSISLSAPSLSLPSGGIGGSALASGAASSNVGTLSGDLSGALPTPSVVNMSNAHTLPVAANDVAAAAAGVAIGKLYINRTAIAGQNLLCVRFT